VSGFISGAGRGPNTRKEMEPHILDKGHTTLWFRSLAQPDF